MAFGWSAGDILAAINFIIKISSALDEASGSSSKFREASCFLRDLNSALRPLETLSLLDTKTVYQDEIRRQVEGIRGPVEKFLNSEEVKKLQDDLGVERGGKWGRIRDVKSKLVWHFRTSEKALELKELVGAKLEIVNSLMQQLTVDMLQSFKSSFKGDVGDSLEEQLNLKLPAFQRLIFDQLSERDKITEKTLLKQVEKLLENYLGPQIAVMSPSTTLVEASEPTMPKGWTPQMLAEDKASMALLEARWQPDFLEDETSDNTRVNTDPQVICALQDWWSTDTSDFLWVQEPQRGIEERGLAHNFAAMAKVAKIPIVAYFCQRLDKSGEIVNQSHQLLEMLHSLIWQLWKQLTISNSSNFDLEPPKLGEIDESLKPAAVLLTKLELLLQAIDGKVVVAIDGFEYLDYSDNDILEGYIHGLFHILKNDQGNGRVKTLVTTMEHTLLVMENIGDGQVVDISLSDSAEGLLMVEDLNVT